MRQHPKNDVKMGLMATMGLKQKAEGISFFTCTLAAASPAFHWYA